MCGGGGLSWNLKNYCSQIEIIKLILLFKYVCGQILIRRENIPSRNIIVAINDFLFHWNCATHHTWCAFRKIWIRFRWVVNNKRVSETRAPLAVRREPAGVQNSSPSVLYGFEHKTKNILIHAPHTHNVAFWHIGNIPLRISWVQFVIGPPYFM